MAKSIIFTRHALERMQKRRISPAEAEETIHTPNISYDAAIPERKNRKVCRKNFVDKKLEVVYEEYADVIVVVTTCWKE